MNGKKNKWGPQLSESVGANPPHARPTDIAAAIAAGLSVRLGARTTTTHIPSVPTSFEFDINDSPWRSNRISWLLSVTIIKFRNILTKKHAHEQLTSYTGVLVKLRGVFKQLGAADSFPNERKLHLYISAPSQEALQRALAILQHCSSTGMMLPNPQHIQNPFPSQPHFSQTAPSNQYPPQLQPQIIPQQYYNAPMQPVLPQQLQFFAPPNLQLLQPSQNGMLDLQQKQFLFCEKVPLGALAGPNVSHPGFSVKGKLLGPQGQNVKHISLVTGAKVQLRGRGASQNPEADGPEDMHLEINASSEVSMKQAMELAFNLVETIRQEYVASVTQPLQATTPSNIYNVSGVQRVVGQSYPPQYHPVTPYPNPHPDMTAAPLFNATHLAARTEQRPLAIAATMQHTVTQSSYDHSSTTPTPTGPSKGCVPFLYPDGDAVIRTSSSNINSKQEPLNLPSSTTPSVVRRSAATSSESFPARLSLNGSTFAVVTRPKEVNTSSRSTSSSSNSGSDNGRSGDDIHSSSGSNKRRRGFKESAVYIGTSEIPMPTSSTHQNSMAGERAVSTTDSTPANGLSRGTRPHSESESGTHGAVSSRGVSMSAEINQKNFTAPSPQGECRSSTFSSSSVVVSEPAPSVISALAAMTERRMQNKAARPLVPVFSAMPPPFASSALSSPHPQRPSSESLQSATHVRTPDAAPLATATPAVAFKLPGLTAYDDDDEDDD